jgi:hypothetical protein
MTFSGLCNKLVYVEFSSPAGIKRILASVYFHAEAAKFFHMGKQLPSNGFLIGFG